VARGAADPAAQRSTHRRYDADRRRHHPVGTAKWLGHDPAITLRVYGHVYDDAFASAAMLS